MTITDELNALFKSSKKEDEQKPPRYIQIRFGVSATDCVVSVVNTNVPMTKLVLDSLEKIPNLHFEEVDDTYKPVGIIYELTEPQENKTESEVKNKSIK